jgi:nicotinic acid phosphoribosyltransferase
MEEKKLYRVENQREQHGLWRDFDGHLSPIFDKLTDGAVKDLPMGDSPLYRAGGNKWFSACETPEMLTHWFSDGDIKELVKLGYGVYEFTATNYKLVSNFETIFTRDSVKECRQISYKDIWKDRDMKFRPIVKSLLDTDLYKFNMNQVMFHKHTNLSGKYVFKCRNEGIVFTKEMLDEINAQVDNLCTMTFTKEEIAYLHTIRFLKPDYIEFLRIWRPLRDYVDVKLSDAGKLSIEVTGPLYGAMQFEIYLLEIVSEVYFRFMYADSYDSLVAEAKKRLLDKIEGFKSGKYTFSFADFGARRRFSGDFQDWALSQLKDLPNCVGTSDVYFAMKYGMKPIGTYAHEFVQMYQGIPTIPLAYTNHAALEDWFDEYRGDNGTALTDTITTDLFLKDFDYLQAQSLFWRPPRQRRSVRMGRKDYRPLQEARHRSDDQDAFVQRFARFRQSAANLRVLQVSDKGRIRHRHVRHERFRRHSAEYRHQASVRQRSAGRQIERLRRQDDVRGS